MTRGFTPGLPGFQGAGEVPDVYGTVRGYRWWSFGAYSWPPLHLNPFAADWMPGYLRGQVGEWLPGENTAECKPGGSHDPALIPHQPCGCGFWAYWALQHHNLGACSLPVCGVVEGYGAVITGEKGFRAAKARIAALHLPLVIMPPGWKYPGAGKYSRSNPWWNHPDFHGRVILDQSVKASYAAPEPAAEDQQEERDRAEAWMAVIGDRLEQMYPGVRVFETREAMEHEYPPVRECPRAQPG